jgi:RNA polymerase sigma-70 factor (ECF subfamily)
MKAPENDPGSDEGLDRTASLARRVQRGDAELFEKLYERVAPSLWAWATLKAPRGVDPSDLLQEVWIRALSGLKRHDSANHEFRAWIFGIAKNVLLQEARNQSRSRARQEAPDSGVPLSQMKSDSVTSISRKLGRDDALAKFLEYARELEREDRDLLVYCALEGFTCAEAGTRLGLSEDATTKRWQRLRAQLREAGWVRSILLAD